MKMIPLLELAQDGRDEYIVHALVGDRALVEEPKSDIVDVKVYYGVVPSREHIRAVVDRLARGRTVVWLNNQHTPSTVTVTLGQREVFVLPLVTTSGAPYGEVTRITVDEDGPTVGYVGLDWIDNEAVASWLAV